MTEFSAADNHYMAIALKLAKRGMYSAHPNPRVGCVIVQNDQIVGQGWHQITGGAHAEVMALKEAGDNARNATAYVTLEPCAHQGKTGPCCDALVAADLSRVVIAVEDPFSEVSGQGKSKIEAAGINVSVGLLESGAKSLNSGYFSRIERNRPFVRLKVATSIDGATAMSNGESKWITGESARQDVQKLRASSGGVMTGIGTVISDNPRLTVRDESITTRQPIRVLLDSQLKASPEAHIFERSAKTLVFCVNDKHRERYENSHVKVHKIETKDKRPELSMIFKILAKEGINDLLVEAGPTLSGGLIENDLIDELVIYQAPHIMGSNTKPMFLTPKWESLQDRLSLDIQDIRKIGADYRITARPINR